MREILAEHDLPAVTEATITSADDLEAIRERGDAINRGEHINGLNALSVAITSDGDDLLGALAVVGPSHRLGDE